MADAETATDENLVQIPQVPTHLRGLVGNLPDVDPSFFAKSIWHLADLYGPIFQLDLVSRKVVVISNYELMKEVLDDDKYEKWVSGALLQVRNITKDGLFTAHSDEPVRGVGSSRNQSLTNSNAIELGQGSSHSHARVRAGGYPQDVQ